MTTNTIGLLAFILGATDTARYPDVAPVGIVNVIQFEDQELIVTGAPFKYTKLFPCELPKPEPFNTTWLPTEAVVAEIPEIIGATEVLELTETLSKTPAARFEDESPADNPM